jgi:hypothetical protein
MQVWIEVPLSWGPRQWLRTRLEQAGYQVRERRIIGLGEIVLEIH